MKHFSFSLATLFMLIFAVGCKKQERLSPVDFQTVCNPVDLSYRFCLGKPSRREAADPSIVLFKGEYYLFLSKSGGYFHSNDLVNWNLVVPENLPLENYAPTAVVIEDEVYFLTSGSAQIFKTKDPKSGKWELAKDDFQITETDPMLFLDDDGRLYYYGGCSNTNPILGAEIDRKTLDVIGKPVKLISSNHEKYGWEVRGDYNSAYDELPWIEGAWMNKHNGKYYLQYASPGTEFKGYNDAVYVSDKPLGPFILADHNPFAYKPEGFATGAGHGSSFTDIYGNYWHIGTVTISVREGFERRLSLFPAFFDSDGEFYTYTRFGDYPMIVPNRKISSPDELFPSWMLLSYNKKVEASSTLEGFPAQNAVDENLRTWWSASTGNKGEYFSVDLGDICDIYALQINFADQDSELLGRNNNICYRYIIEQSVDGKKWKTLIDKSLAKEDVPHDYIQLTQPVKSRYLRINNVKVPSGKFSLSGFRVFGKGNKEAPQAVSSIAAEKLNDCRTVKLNWEKISNVTGYNVRFGIHKDKLYNNYIVYGKNNLTINALNAEKTYFYSIDSFNENGVTRGKVILQK
ncbi:MAG: family 43 glycosylhydrolase [Prevotellaceae bacterium]|jgi:hypothetical protein|nr:family 43 glycosylhydrolase [Prevotellaceae bacterium]